jgi:transposase-like protein
MDLKPLANPQPVAKPRRARQAYTREFKAQAVAACGQPGSSVAAIAMDLRVNANVLRRWIREAERSLLQVSTLPLPTRTPGLVPAVVGNQRVPGSDLQRQPSGPLQITVKLGEATIIIDCPNAAEQHCAQLLREWLR